jgi:glycosyltransferase involved in cell wall biosynthesis
MDPGLVEQARREQAENHRYRWYGELDGAAARELLASADVLACTSISEGGANVVTEAVALGVPVIGTRIDGNVGLLGSDHPGLVPVGDDRAFADLLERIERDPDLLAALQRRTDELQPLTDPAVEQAELSSLVDRLLGADGSAQGASEAGGGNVDDCGHHQ